MFIRFFVCLLLFFLGGCLFVLGGGVLVWFGLFVLYRHEVIVPDD